MKDRWSKSHACRAQAPAALVPYTQMRQRTKTRVRVFTKNAHLSRGMFLAALSELDLCCLWQPCMVKHEIQRGPGWGTAAAGDAAVPRERRVPPQSTSNGRTLPNLLPDAGGTHYGDRRGSNTKGAAAAPGHSGANQTRRPNGPGSHRHQVR